MDLSIKMVILTNKDMGVYMFFLKMLGVRIRNFEFMRSVTLMGIIILNNFSKKKKKTKFFKFWRISNSPDYTCA